jgi:dolichyl-phosphate-mannose-protein mannosyltransferase
VSPEHPPLLKELSALALRQAGVRWPQTAQATAAANGDPQSASAVARSIIVDNGPDRVMFWARLPLIFVATALVFAVYMLGRRLIGEAAAVGAAFLCAFDPNILAHSFLVTTDVGVATFLVLFMVALWDYLSRPGLARAIICGIALGAALAAKYSAVILPPVAALLMLAAARWPTEVAEAKPGSRGSKGKAEPVQHSLRPLFRYATGFGAMCVAAFLLLQETRFSI